MNVLSLPPTFRPRGRSPLSGRPLGQQPGSVRPSQEWMLLSGLLALLANFQGGRPATAGGPPAGAAQPRVVELQKGQTFTTPGGATIAWNGDEVKVHEPGGGSSGRPGASGPLPKGSPSTGNQEHPLPEGSPSRGNQGGNGYLQALASALGDPTPPGARAPGGNWNVNSNSNVNVNQNLNVNLNLLQRTGLESACCAGGGPAAAAVPRDWRVWGDPHIDHPDGSKSDFDRKNALFTLQDGTRVLMGADNPKGVVEKVQIVLPGGEPNWSGFDPAQTSVMQDNGKGHFESVGTADRPG